MTVKELRDKLAQFPEHKEVLVYWEDQARQNFFEVDELSMPNGMELRDSHGKPAFKFDKNGAAARVLITVIPEE